MKDNKILETARSYLGSNEKLDAATEERLTFFLSEMKSGVKPLHLYGVYDLIIEKERVILKDTIIDVCSKDLADLLKNSRKCILIACTLGIDVENKLRRYSKYNVLDGIIYDALAAAYIEEYLNMVNENLKVKYEYLTMRYSPGYGDLDLSVQPKILNLLQANKKIGLTSNENHLLIPRKSITAFIGIQNTPWESKTKLCDSCKLKDTCKLRKEGKFCGNIK